MHTDLALSAHSRKTHVCVCLCVCAMGWWNPERTCKKPLVFYRLCVGVSLSPGVCSREQMGSAQGDQLLLLGQVTPAAHTRPTRPRLTCRYAVRDASVTHKYRVTIATAVSPYSRILGLKNSTLTRVFLRCG